MATPWVHPIDCDYVHARFACAYLLAEEGKAAFVDNNTTHALPKLMAALEQQGLKPEDVEYIIVTHVHLDHAGGTGVLLQKCPNATVLAHPRAARHLIDPTKLIHGAEAVYGKERFNALYGEILAVPENRVRALDDGSVVAFGARELHFLHTRGHANHHFCIWEPKDRNVFTGDSFGLRYPDLQLGGLFIFPSTSPTDFDPAAALSTIDRIRALRPTTAWLTHFGGVRTMDEAALQLREDLLFSKGLLIDAQTRAADPNLTKQLLERLKTYYQEKLSNQGFQFKKKHWDLMEMDLELNAQGIAWAATKAASPGPTSSHPPERQG